MEDVGKFFTAIIIVLLGLLIAGFMIMKLWNWYLVPMFEFPILSFKYAMGVGVVYAYLKMKITKDELEWDEIGAQVLKVIVINALYLLIAWILQAIIIG